MNEKRTVHLTRKEKDLLLFLRQNAGKCISRDVLLQQVWGYREGVKSRTLDVHVQRLRKKLGPEEGARILTVFRGGYLWSAGHGTSGIRLAGDGISAPINGSPQASPEAGTTDYPHSQI